MLGNNLLTVLYDFCILCKIIYHVPHHHLQNLFLARLFNTHDSDDQANDDDAGENCRVKEN